MIDHHETTEVQDIPETIEVQDIPETTEVQDIPETRGSRYSRDDSRYSRDDRGSRYSRDNDREDTTVTCADCGDQCTVPFVPRSDKPVYCSDCFRKYKPDDSGNDRPSRDDRGSRYSRDDRGSRYSRDDRGSRYSRDDRGSRYSRDNDREDTTVTCADCGDQCTVPFVPRSDKPVYCSDCFRKYKPDDSGNDRPSRDDKIFQRRFQDIPETIEVQDIPETIEVQDIPEIMTVKTQL